MKSIGGIGGTNSLPEVDGDATRAKRNSSAPPAGSAAASARFSKPGELFSKLQQLAEQDPEKLKEVAGKIADSLHQAAAKTGGAGEFLEKLAASFDEVAKSGDLADLRPKNDAPPTGPAPGQRHIHHHHHHHHHHNRMGGRAADIGAELEKALNMVTDALAPTGTSGPTTGTTPVETAPTAPVPTPTPEA